MLTPRENILRIFRHEMPEWIPITGHVDPYNQPNREGMDPELAEALGTVEWGDESTVIFSRYLDLDIFDWFSNPPVRSIRHNVTIDQTQHGEDTHVVWHTPRGELTEVIRRGRGKVPSYRIKHLLERPEDIAAFASIFEDETFEPNPKRAAELEQRRELIGDGGIVAFPMGGTPLGMLVRVYSGVAATAYLYADAPDALRDLFSVMEDNFLRRMRIALRYDAEVIVCVDDTSTTTISPAMFEAYCMEFTDRAAELCHQAGKIYMHHSCGLIKDLLDLYSQTRMDCVHAFTIPPIGDVSIREGREKLGQIVIFAGLVQLFGSLDDWPAVQSSVREMFAGAAPGDHFMLGLAADPEKGMDQTKRLLDDARKYQRIE